MEGEREIVCDKQEGDRATVVKVTLEQQVAVAQAFTAKRAPALACLTANGLLQVYSLPGLQAISTQTLASILNFPWSWEGHQLAEKLQKICSIASGGQAFLPKLSGEAVRLGLCHSGPPPVPSASLIDLDLIQATLAARQARPSKQPSRSSRQVEAVRTQRYDEDSGDDVSVDTLDSPLSPTDNLRPCNVDQKRGLGNLFHQVRDGVVNVGSLVEGTSKGIGRELGNVLASKGRKNRKPNPPTLDHIFNSQQGLVSGGAVPASHREQQSRRAKGGMPSGSDARPPPEFSGADESRRRSELLGDRLGPIGRKAGLRSAAEVRRAYGRPARNRSETAASIAMENRRMLAERGEKLDQLGSKAEAMANDASNFASIAQQIRQKEANKKWWQF